MSSQIEQLIDIYDGGAWQSLATSLLFLKYGEGLFLKVPDQHRGDWGIEGYTLEGDVFQCYAPERQHEVERLYELQRAKVTEDIKKFKDNKDELIKLLPENVKYRRWYFLTTVHLSKKLVSHCAVKSKDVIKDCDHVTPDFAVMPHHASDFFLVELPKYINLGKERLKLRLPEVTEEVVQDFISGSKYLSTIKDKLIAGNVKRKSLDSLSLDYVHDYLIWRSLLKDLKDVSPEVHEILASKIDSLELNIKKKYQLQNNLNVAELEYEFSKLRESIDSQLKSNVDPTTLDYLARGVVADWIIRCPINF